MADRRERVILELVDSGFSTGMAKDAAAVALLNRELKALSGTSVAMSRASVAMSRDTDQIGKNVAKASSEIDRFSGRLGLALRAVAAFGPALVPIGAAAIPAIAGLTAGVGALAGALGVTVLAVSGLGDAMDALDAYQLEPTAENLAAMRDEFEKIGPAGEQFVRYLDSIEPALESIQHAAREGLFPGVEDGIDAMLTKLPGVRRLVFDLSTALGDVAADAGAGLAGPKFEAFFEYLDTDAAPTLRAFAEATGNVAEGLANLMVAFAPASRDFTDGLVAATDAFANWTAGLENNQGFQDFLQYVRDSGPQVIALVGQLAQSLAAVAEAAAPIGSVLLPALTAVAAVIEELAGSDLGTPLLAGVAAMSALRLATQAWGKVAGSTVATVVTGNARIAGSYLTVTSAQQRATMSATQLAAAESARNRAALVGAGKLSAGLAGLAIAATSAGDGLGLTNTASLALMGTVAGPLGTAVGAGVGAILDIKASAQNASDALQAFDDAMRSGDPEEFAAALEQVNAQLELQTRNTVLGSDALGDFAGGIINTIAPASNLDKLVGQITGSTDDLAEAADTAAPAMNRLSSSNWGVEESAGKTAAQIDSLVSAMQDQTSAAASAFDAVTQYGQALADANEAAKKGKRGIDENTEAGRENRTALAGLRDAWNAQSDAVKNNRKNYQDARDDFLRVAEAMGVGADKAKRLADNMLDIPRSRIAKVGVEGAENATGLVAQLNRELSKVVSKTITITANTVRTGIGNLFDVGGYTGDIPATQIAGFVHGDEFVTRAKSRRSLETAKPGALDYMNATGRWPGYFDGGHVAGYADGGKVRSLEDQLAIAQILQQIRDYRRTLAKDGKNKLEGLERRIAELQLKAAEKELRLAETREKREAKQELREARQEARELLINQRGALAGLRSGPSFDSLLPSEPQTVLQGVAAEIADFRRQIEDAGGTWTKELHAWADEMRATAQEYDTVVAAIESETKRRDELVDTLNEQKSQLDDLNRTMAAFGASVAANFLNNGFGRSVTVAGTPGAQSSALTSAQAQLAAIQAQGGTGASAQASRLMQQIALLQQGADAESGSRELTGLDALRNTLSTDAANASAFTAALQQLVQQGLDPLSGFYKELATSGDLLTAQQLVAAGPGGIDELEALWQQRDQATAELAAMTTQEVYGQQQAALEAQIAQTNQLIAQVDAAITFLNATQVVLAEQLRLGPGEVAALLQPQVDAVNTALAGLPAATARELQVLIRKLVK